MHRISRKELTLYVVLTELLRKPDTLVKTIFAVALGTGYSYIHRLSTMPTTPTQYKGQMTYSSHLDLLHTTIALLYLVNNPQECIFSVDCLLYTRYICHTEIMQ